jgi:hypothetical protein
MALTKSFKELVQGRVTRDPAFAATLLREGIDTMLTDEMDTGKAILRDYIKALTVSKNSVRRPAPSQRA